MAFKAQRFAIIDVKSEPWIVGKRQLVVCLKMKSFPAATFCAAPVASIVVSTEYGLSPKPVPQRRTNQGIYLCDSTLPPRRSLTRMHYRQLSTRLYRCLLAFHPQAKAPRFRCFSNATPMFGRQGPSTLDQ
jgi:hypothetical protein